MDSIEGKESVAFEAVPLVEPEAVSLVDGCEVASQPEAASMVECPLCQSFFPSYAVEVHASHCMMTTGGTTLQPTHTLGIITID